MIVGVAIWYDGRVYARGRPFRHHHIRHWIYLETGNADAEETSVEGFLDHDGKFLNRTEALIVASECGQLRKNVPIMHEELCSEHLW